MKKAKEIKKEVLKNFLPPPELKVSEWAEQNFNLSPEFSSITGKINLNITPYLREILDSLNDPKVKKITWVASSQVAKTTMLLIAMSYFIAHEPSPMLFITKTKDMAKELSKERFRAVIRDNKALKDVLDGEDSTDNLYSKIFPGGLLVFGSATTLGDLISRPIKIIFLDEVDTFPAEVSKQGNPIDKVTARVKTFSDSKVFTVSVPGIKDESNVMKAYNKSDMRVYKVPCPFCNHFQEMIFANIQKHEDSWTNATYKCEKCSSLIEEKYRHKMVRSGRWESTNPNPEESRHIGFKINQLYSLFPDITWGSIGAKLSEAKRLAALGDKAPLKVFWNETMGETWDDQHLNNIDEHELMARREIYPAEVPLGVGYLTAGVDFQADRAEVSVLGFGKNNHIWLIDHKIFYGDPGLDPDSPNAQIYRDLDAYLEKDFKHESGQHIWISKVFLDVGDGNRTIPETKFAFGKRYRGYQPIKGSRNVNDAAFTGSSTKDPATGLPIYYVGTHALKDDINGRLRIKYPTEGAYIHFPKDYTGERVPRYSHINTDYFKQLTSEKLIEKKEAGHIRKVWVKKYGSIRNEALDCFVYAMAAYIKRVVEDGYFIDEKCDEYEQDYQKMLAQEIAEATGQGTPAIQEASTPPPGPMPQETDPYAYLELFKNKSKRF